MTNAKKLRIPFTLLNWITRLISMIFSFLGIAVSRYGNEAEKEA